MSDFVADANDVAPRTSQRAVGAASVYRSTCADEEPNDDRETVFPSYDDGGIKSVADQASDFLGAVTAAHDSPTDGKVTLQLWTPNCPVCTAGSNRAYWARYYTREADSAVRPRLVVTYETTAAPVASVTLNADTSTPQAGAAEVPLAAVPPSAILDASRVVAAPLADTPLADTPLADTPLADIPLADIGFGDVAGLLKTVPLSTLPLKREGGWPALLARLDAEFPASAPVQDLVAKQLQQITLGDLYALDPPPSELDPSRPASGPDDDITLSELDLTNSPLGDLSTLDVILGSTPLSEVNIPDRRRTPTTDGARGVVRDPRRRADLVLGTGVPRRCDDHLDRAPGSTARRHAALRHAALGHPACGHPARRHASQRHAARGHPTLGHRSDRDPAGRHAARRYPACGHPPQRHPPRRYTARRHAAC